MANPYHDFTAAPISSYGAQAVNDSLHGAVSTYVQKMQERDQMQKALALEVAKAKIAAWQNQQDPIARALTMGKLGTMGFDVSQMNGQGTGDISSMLQGNPYASMVGGGGGYSAPSPQPSMPQPSGGSAGAGGGFSPMPSFGGTPASVNPPAGGGGNSGQPASDLAITSYDRNPFGGVLPKTIDNVPEQARLAGAKSYGQNISTTKANEATAAQTLEGLTRNMVADLKSTLVESGGGGPIKGRVSSMMTHLGGSPATYGYANTKRDTAIAYARNLAGGSQGVQRLFSSILDTIPDQNATPEQMGTAALQMHLTGRQLQAGMASMGLQPQDLKKMDDEQLQQVLSAGSIDRGQETNAFMNIMRDIKPTKVASIEGIARDPKPNALATKFGWNYNPGGQGNPSQGNSGGIPKYNPKTQKLQQNTKTGEYRVVDL